MYGVIALLSPKNVSILMANNWLVIKAKRLKIGDLTKFNNFFCLLKSICLLACLIKQNVNSDVNKDSLTLAQKRKRHCCFSTFFLAEKRALET